ncbi:2-polyprenyl-3-methyl-5-hydroxy-6-metoxy-1,4-ben zoquinolmethylase (plasmid) [Peptoclostridium acidaminophilum DSM 3953]|uniref:2-polyprenyl-3-methyl-5-hydroxy-6-metoxy-1,4-ben zoquinolmethylase n=1 Tax=Peptoclostridium acidaminophilum DSM 3953 TaxID=1286171 RepID=W8UB78_PEPAC|nr:class I SAM-dependent methyltransferase [Peptoclostridium acidaminophilum]AHM58041.1 2-polyprenyl-3-methyl-5-hydroxy-6-metoxy-1,4-ben zoquinolmethylase [Peptoclostridium acidaminophilum DSM 3953]
MSNKCKICGFETRKIHSKQFNADYHYCERCEFISKDENAIISPEDELTIYNDHNNSIDDPRYVAYFYKFLEAAVFNYVNEGKKGLDFGSGPSPVLAQILEKNHGYAVDIYDLYYSPEKVYLNKKYDLVTSTEVVEHLKDPLEYFSLFKGLLCDTGVLAVMTLFHQNDEQHFLRWHYMRDKSHISFYTTKTMEYIADLVGLKVIHTNGIRYTTFAVRQ